MRIHLRALVFFAALFTISIVLAAQVRVDVRLVNIIATVTDDAGRYIGNLTADDFIVQEDGALQKISHFSQDHDVPVSVGVILDTSGSMERKIRTAVDAVDRFIRRTNTEDEIFLMTFSSEPLLRQDFSNDRDKLSQSLRKMWVTGGTALYDAVNEGIEKVQTGRHEKRALLVITDGQDTSSVTKLEGVLQNIRQTEVLVYAIGITPSSYSQKTSRNPFNLPLPAILSGRSSRQNKRDDVDMKVLHAFAENSGGRAFLLSENFSKRGTEIEKVLTRVADELRSQYTLGYYPPQSDDGQFHSIQVRTTTGGSVRTRKGYLADGLNSVPGASVP
jgi:Ca-activated chloride channel homolog